MKDFLVISRYNGIHNFFWWSDICFYQWEYKDKQKKLNSQETNSHCISKKS